MANVGRRPVVEPFVVARREAWFCRGRICMTSLALPLLCDSSETRVAVCSLSAPLAAALEPYRNGCYGNAGMDNIKG